jgi:D-methionine transport system ATP-binding protein
VIEFKNVTKIFKTRGKTVRALDHINLTIEDGDIYGIIGFSGAGKSTLIRMINALEKPTEGEVMVDRKSVGRLSFNEMRKERRHIGMIFQQFNLLNSKSVFDNVAIPMVLAGKSKQEIREKTEKLLSFVGLGDKADVYPDQLSGGQKQRVGIARALAMDPTIILSDEATSALDPDTMTAILELLRKINREMHITIVMVTHQIKAIQQICNKVAVMKAGQIIESGDIFTVFSNPREQVTADFVRTVIPDQVSPSVWQQIENEKSLHFKVFNFKFLNQNATSSLIWRINKKFQAETRILHAAVAELCGRPVGIVILQIIGNDEEIQKIIKFAEENGVVCSEVKR